MLARQTAVAPVAAEQVALRSEEDDDLRLLIVRAAERKAGACKVVIGAWNETAGLWRCFCHSASSGHSFVGFRDFSFVVGWAPAFSVIAVRRGVIFVFCHCWNMVCGRYSSHPFLPEAFEQIVIHSAFSSFQVHRLRARLKSERRKSVNLALAVRMFVMGTVAKRGGTWQKKRGYGTRRSAKRFK